MQITTEAKRAIINCLQNAAYANENAQPLFEALNNAFFPLTSISAVYTQSGTVTAATPLETLKDDLVVTAQYEGGDTEVLEDSAYALSGTLNAGTSVITVSYQDKTTTFNVVVSSSDVYVTSGLIHRWDGIDNTGNGHSGSSTIWKDLVGSYDLTLNGNVSWGDSYASFDGVNTSWMKSSADDVVAPQGKTVEVVFEASRTDTSVVAQLCYDQSLAEDAYGKIVIYSDNTVAVRGKSGYTYSTGETAITNVRHIAGAYTNAPDIAAVYVNGVPSMLSNKSHSLKNSFNRMVIGGGMASDGGITSYRLLGKIYAIRIYNRNLTAEEIAQNYAVDVNRFGL